MKTKNLILLALAGAGIYFIYNKMKKKTLPTASAVKKDLTENKKDVAKEYDLEVKER